ncbi:two-component response regulator ORR42-like [Panicum miliaceum]|uniref:Two-component response regulator ORR42-like n=1 Tax=Panicum miliaceum TaxID=4540 RepID=A0A3L6QB63_PANMI|nr:two-component response regulator ORR42-like [Panicum miliaceum]
MQWSATKALVVEDIKVDCVILLRMLRKLNCETTVAQNGKEAVDLFLEGNTFDIVFFDKDMPLMTGPEAVTKIRSMGATEVKMVGVSADFGGMEAFMRAGADMFVPKPMKLETLDSMLQEIIGKKNMSCQTKCSS